MVELKLTPFEVEQVRKRFWAKVDKNGPMPTTCDPSFGNCWFWTGSFIESKSGHRRPIMSVKSKNLVASRIAWFLTHGEWPKKNVCHVCDHPACVRPEHHFEGTDDENVLDARAKARGGILIMVAKGTRAYSVPNTGIDKAEIEWGVD